MSADGARSIDARLLPRRCIAIAALAVPLHVALARATELSPDEAYYLAAARAGGFMPPIADHPPLLMWLLRAADVAPLPLELRVRAIAIACAFATSLACVALARLRGADRRGAELVAIATTFSLLPTAGGFIATPDGPALLAIVVALLFVAAPRPRAVGVGAALFVACLAKVVALPVALAIFAAAPDRRIRWAAVIGSALALPWMAPSLRFQLGHAFADHPSAWSFWGALAAVAIAGLAQAGLWTPTLLLQGARAVRNRPVDRAIVVLLSSLVLVSALVRATPPEPNWWAPAALVVVVASGSLAWGTLARAVTVALLLVPTGVVAAHVMHPFLRLARANDPTARLHGWRGGLDEPLDAPGIGPYGPAAERCIYLHNCRDIHSYFQTVRTTYTK